MKLMYFTVAELATIKSGAKSHIEGILYGLYKLGWDITLFSAEDSSGVQQPRYPFRHVLIRRATSSLKDQLMEQVRLGVKLLFWREVKPDCVYIRANYSLIVPVFFALLHSIPYFVEINALAEIEGRHKRLIPLAVRVENWILKHACGVFLVTKELRDYFIKRTGLPAEKFEVIANACETDICDTAIESGRVGCDNIVGFLGSFQERQGVETILYAAPIIRRAIPGARFIFAGTGSEEERYRTLAEVLGVFEAVEFPGFVSQEHVASMIESFDVAVAPYIGMLAKIPMGSPLKVYTYLGCGRVVVTSDLPSLHIFKECSAVRFATPDDPEDFAIAIIAVLRMTPQKRAELGRAGREYILNGFTWDISAKRTADHIVRWCEKAQDVKCVC